MTHEQPPMPLTHSDVIDRLRLIDTVLPGNGREDIAALLLALVHRTVTSGGSLTFLQAGIGIAWATHPDNDRGIPQ